MSTANKFWKGMLWGAIAGGAISLLDKQTRTIMKENCAKAAKNVSYAIKNPDEISNQLKEKALRFKAAVEEVSEDISYISSKVEEIRDTTPQVAKMLKDTKNTFTKNSDDIDLEQD